MSFRLERRACYRFQNSHVIPKRSSGLQYRVVSIGREILPRSLSLEFLDDLRNGILSPLLAKVRSDDTLMLALRGNYINIYYRGGSILRVTQRASASEYDAFFDKEYCKISKELKTGPSIVNDAVGASAWVDTFKYLKEVMNDFFSAHPKFEREFQQLVAWENNRSTLANETEYFITDIELAHSNKAHRNHMLGLKWLSTHRQTGLKCWPVFIEMKYGDEQITGPAGIAKHVRDLTQILAGAERRAALNLEIIEQFNQLNDLGLVRYEKSDRVKDFKITRKPEVVFLLANHNPRSERLLKVLEEIEESAEFDLRFFVASFAGYGMHDACMLRLDEFRERVKQLLNLAK